MDSENNVFKDIGFSDDESNVLLEKSRMMNDIDCYAHINRMTIHSAKIFFGVDASVILAISQGEIHKLKHKDLVQMISRIKDSKLKNGLDDAAHGRVATRNISNET